MSNHFGISLSENEDGIHDIHFNERSLATVSKAEAVAQHCRQRLLTFSEEWFLDKEAGVPWLDEVLGQEYDPDLAESIIKAEILETDGVSEITSFSVKFDRTKRHLSAYDIEIRTKYDEVVVL